MTYHYAVLIVGIVWAGMSGEIFVRGAVGLARWGRISSGIVGATVAAFATSSPELSVSINSALVGKPQIALGDALGSSYGSEPQAPVTSVESSAVPLRRPGGSRSGRTVRP